MKTDELYTSDEMEMFQRIEAGNYTPISDEDFTRQKARLEAIAANTLRKKTRKKSLNIRLFEADIEKIKIQALHEGLPYQTYLASMVHKIAEGQYRPVATGAHHA